MLNGYYYIYIKAENAVRFRHHCSAGVIIGDGKIYATSPSKSLLYYYTPTRTPHTHLSVGNPAGDKNIGGTDYPRSIKFPEIP